MTQLSETQIAEARRMVHEMLARHDGKIEPSAPVATEPLLNTYVQWRNREIRFDSGEIKHTKVIARSGPFEQYEYGGTYEANLPRCNGYRPAKGKGRAYYDGPEQWALVHTLKTKSGVIDTDDPTEYLTTSISGLITSDYRWIQRSDDHGHWHARIDGRNIPEHLWPTQGPIDLKNHWKGNGFTPVPGCKHFSGAIYDGVLWPDGSVPLVVGRPEHGERLIADRETADRRLAEIRGQQHREGGTNSSGTGGGHDGEMAAYCLRLRHRGLSDDEIYELWRAKADEEEDPAWPFDNSDFDRHMKNVDSKYQVFAAKTSWPDFKPPPADGASVQAPKEKVMADTGSDSSKPVTETPSLNGRDPAPETIADGVDLPGDSGAAKLHSDKREALEVTNAAILFDVLCHRLGQGTLSGIFNRADQLVVVPRYGEIGYKPVSDAGRTVEDPPAQIRPVDADNLVGFIAGRRWCYKVNKKGTASAALPPVIACKAVVKTLPENWFGVPRLMGVTHTPLLRADGSILNLPGYDEATGLLYLPECNVPEVPDNPSAADIDKARNWLLYMVQDFRFIRPGDKANYLGVFLTPLLRCLLPPPWPQLGINAPQPGSGKTLLATLLRIVYGGEEHSAPESGKPSDVDAELRKVISTVLLENTGQITVFDNLNGVFRSGKMAKLLTGLHWSDRGLGGLKGVHAINDRIWVLTGNNLQVGGDLPRRTIWTTINSDMEHPEERTDMAEADLPGWAETNRANLLWSGLVLARAAYPELAKLKKKGQRRTDCYGRWDAGIRCLLAKAGIPGGFWEPDTAVTRAGEDDDEWGEFLSAIYSMWGSQQWTARQLADGCAATMNQATVIGGALPGDLPASLYKPAELARKLGAWLKNRQNRWAGGYAVCNHGAAHARITLWSVKRA